MSANIPNQWKEKLVILEMNDVDDTHKTNEINFNQVKVRLL